MSQATRSPPASRRAGASSIWPSTVTLPEATRSRTCCQLAPGRCSRRAAARVPAPLALNSPRGSRVVLKPSVVPLAERLASLVVPDSGWAERVWYRGAMEHAELAGGIAGLRQGARLGAVPRSQEPGHAARVGGGRAARRVSLDPERARRCLLAGARGAPAHRRRDRRRRHRPPAAVRPDRDRSRRPPCATSSRKTAAAIRSSCPGAAPRGRWASLGRQGPSLSGQGRSRKLAPILKSRGMLPPTRRSPR